MTKLSLPLFLLTILLLASCAPSAAQGTNTVPNTGAGLGASSGFPTTAVTYVPTATLGPSATAVSTESPTTAAAATPVPTAAFAVTGVETGVNLNNVSQASYNGVCTGALTFQANISANGAGTVTYHWLRSDGTSSSAFTLNFTASGYRTVTDTWTASAASTNFTASDQVIVDTPTHQSFSPAAFSLNCNPVLPKARPAGGRGGKLKKP